MATAELQRAAFLLLLLASCCRAAVVTQPRKPANSIDVESILSKRLGLNKKDSPQNQEKVEVSQPATLALVQTMLEMPLGLNTSMERPPEMLYHDAFWEIVDLSKQLSASSADAVSLLKKITAKVTQLPTHLCWSVTRRIVLAGIALHRINAGPYSAAAQAGIATLCQRFFELHKQAAVRKGIVDFFHVSKAGGTSFCQLGKLNGCRTQSFAARRNCLIREFDDVPRWVNNSLHKSLAPEGLRTPWFANYGMKHNAVSCRLRKKFMLRRRYNVYANEFTLHGGTRLARNVHVCPGHLNVLQLRHPHDRLVSHLKWVWALYDHHFKEQAAAYFPTRDRAHWGALMPAATHNYLIRSMLGEAVYYQDAKLLDWSHLELARMTLAQFDVLLLLEVPDMNTVLMEMGLGWGLGFGTVHARTSSQLHEVGSKGLPPDLDEMLKANALDLELYKFGYMLAHLDAVLFDVAKEMGLGVGYEAAQIRTTGEGGGDGGAQVAGQKAQHPGDDEQWELTGNTTLPATCGYVTMNDKNDPAVEWLLV